MRIPESGPIGAGGVLNDRLKPPGPRSLACQRQVVGPHTVRSATFRRGERCQPSYRASLWAIEEYWGRSLPKAPPVIKASIPRKSRTGDDYQVMARAQPRALSLDLGGTVELLLVVAVSVIFVNSSVLPLSRSGNGPGTATGSVT